MDNCVFCEKIKNKTIKLIYENQLAIAFFDEFPVNEGHMLIITKKHYPTFFDISDQEQKAMIDLLNKSKKYLDDKYNPDGYNVGLNCGSIAGQSVMHVHMHIIPRYKDDVKNPRGGIRCVIPNKKNY